MPDKANHSLAVAYRPVLFWLGLASLVWITLLLYAGGFTTTIRAGMAFLDWPLSNGSINPEGWLQDRDMAAEHSHRLLGMVMGLLSIALCVAAFRFKAARAVRRMGVALVILVVAQGLLGGLRVLLDQLNLQIDHNLYAQSFAVAHATTAQLFLCLLVSFVVATSRSWIERDAGFAQRPADSVPAWGLAACATLVLQLVVGAVMRHAHAGLAIPTFPLTPHGTLVPPVFDFAIAVHFAHRVGAMVVTVAIVGFCARIWTNPASRRALGGSAVGLLALLALQVLLGALVIWKVRNEHVTTLHMLNGAFTLALCWAATYRSLKSKFDGPARAPAPESSPRGARAATPGRIVEA